MLPPVLELYVVWHPTIAKVLKSLRNSLNTFTAPRLPVSSGKPLRFSFVAKAGARMTMPQGPFRLHKTPFRMGLSLPIS